MADLWVGLSAASSVHMSVGTKTKYLCEYSKRVYLGYSSNCCNYTRWGSKHRLATMK